MHHTGENRYLPVAKRLAYLTIEHLQAEDGSFYDTRYDPQARGSLRQRNSSILENAVMADALLRLSHVSFEADLAEKARDVLAAFLPDYRSFGHFVAGYARVVDLLVTPPVHVTIVGPRDADATAALRRGALRPYVASRIVQTIDPELDAELLAKSGLPAPPRAGRASVRAPRAGELRGDESPRAHRGADDRGRALELVLWARAARPADVRTSGLSPICDDRGVTSPASRAAHAASLLTLLGTLCLAAPASTAQTPRYRGEPLHYEAEAVDGPLERLAQRLATGELELEEDPRHGVLPALLEALEVPVSSQSLVFSKTSFQDDWISPRTPRAVYFGDEVYVGAVPGAPLIEITSIDPRRGTVFYTLPRRASERRAALPVRRHGECLQCHESARTGGWPANLLRSVHTAADGHPILRAGALHVGHETPFEDRWGGWYVTGEHGSARHMGNAVVLEGEERVDREVGANVTDLSGRFDVTRYLSPHSDLVALLVLEHQASMHNRITRAGYEARLALHRQRGTNRLLGEDPTKLRESTQRVFEGLADDLVEYLLFRDEARLKGPRERDLGLPGGVRGPAVARTRRGARCGS